MSVLYHGTGARRKQSIKRRGLLPKPDSYIFASRSRMVAAIFATARAEIEGDWGMVVVFLERGEWEIDPAFPDSVRSKATVDASDILKCEIINPSHEIEAYNFLKQVVKALKIRMEGRRNEKEISVYTENKSK